MVDKNILKGKKHIHMIGIGGSGMYPLAQILYSQGYHLSGSDNNETETLDAVRKMGVKVYMGQAAENIEGADLIVYSAAIMADNPELVAAKASSADVIERSDLLGIVTGWYDNAICISGTHGKTTASSMTTQILLSEGVDLSCVIGGKLKAIGGSGRAGKSDVMVCESCEFVDTFLKLYPEAKLYVIEPRDFTPTKRQRVLAEIRDGDHDAVIISYGSFSLIPLSRREREKELLDAMAEISESMRTAVYNDAYMVLNR